MMARFSGSLQATCSKPTRAVAVGYDLASVGEDEVRRSWQTSRRSSPKHGDTGSSNTQSPISSEAGLSSFEAA